MPPMFRFSPLYSHPFFFPADGNDGGSDDGNTNDDKANDRDDQGGDESLGDAGKKALDTEREARKKAEKDARDLKKRLDQTEADQKKRDDDNATKNGEWEKLAKDREAENAELKRMIDERDRQDRKRAAAKKHNLADEWIERLSGETDEDLDADAKALAKMVGSREAPETDTEKRTGSKTNTKKTGDPLTSYEFGKTPF